MDAPSSLPASTGRTRGQRALLISLAVAVGSCSVVVLVVTLGFDRYWVPTRAMEPTISSGDDVVAWSFGDPSAGRGDVVVYEAPASTRERGAPSKRISRIVAVGDDEVEAVDGQLMVNGRSVDESYLDPGTTTTDLPPTTVPDGSVFLLGDNRDNAHDSRAFGPVPEDDLHGRVILTNLPFDMLLKIGLGLGVSGGIILLVVFLATSPKARGPRVVTNV